MGLDDIKLTLVETLDELDDFRRWLSERRTVLGLDIETTGLSLAKDKIRTVQFGDGKAAWVLPYEEWRGAIRQVLTDYEGSYVLQHAKFDAGFLIRDGLPFPWERAHDTMFMSHLTNSLGPKALKAAAAYYVDEKARSGQFSLGKAMRQGHWDYDTVPIGLPVYWGYGALDTALTALLAEELWPRIQPYRQAYDLEMACERVLCEMELRGVRIDVAYCQSEKVRLELELEQALERLGDVNPSAPVQVIEALLAAGAPLTKRTQKGQLSVDDEVLQELAQAGYALANDVQQARWLRKVVSSYFENFLSFRSGDRLRPHINQLAARTGRMSVTEPALQTLPRARVVRDAFIPSEDHKLVLVDYDNQELRVAAHFSGDEGMLEAFSEGRDLHGESARRIFGEGYTTAQRATGKAAMFAKAYGAGPAKFALTTGLRPDEAAQVFHTLDEIYPGMARTMAEVTNRVRERAAGNEYGYIGLVDGRHLKVPADKAYMGFNYLIQGSCAVVLKQALVDLDLAGLGQFAVLPVHDEIVFDVPSDDVEEVVPLIKDVMTREDFKAPLTVGATVVDRWGEKYREEE
jgi:DNA polymerase-1